MLNKVFGKISVRRASMLNRIFGIGFLFKDGQVKAFIEK